MFFPRMKMKRSQETEKNQLKERVKIASMLMLFSVELFQESVSGRIKSLAEMQDFVFDWVVNYPYEVVSKLSYQGEDRT